MLLYLLRHAEAVDEAESDAVRELTEKGVTQAKKVGKFCVKNKFIPQIILTSPLKRAEQTARIVAKEIKIAEFIIDPMLSAGMQPETALDELKTYARFTSLMLVGHEPDFSLLAAHLLGIPLSESLRLRKASLTAMNLTAMRPGGAVLEFTLPPKLM
ncbi:MAG TPA: phosphohistidine phosphatase SixA [Chthoniobacteraceae bacterium]|nr:phosphohistidine phosphatase SixA [Chthoniobacteraceae bacterium]